MEDKACRLEILKRLKELYNQDPHALVQKESIVRACRIEESVLERNLKYLEQKRLVYVKWFSGGGFDALITPAGLDFLETGEPSRLAIQSPLTVHQEFHGPVGKVAERDINTQISFTEVLSKLAEAVEADEKIPLEDKRSLLDRLKPLAENKWIRSIGTSVLTDLIKKWGYTMKVSENEKMTLARFRARFSVKKD